MNPPPTGLYTLSLHVALRISGPQNLPRVRHAPDPASNSKRNEQPVSDAAHQIDESPALLRTRVNIEQDDLVRPGGVDRKSTRLNSSHSQISYADFCP